jgi:hypothetical protein
VKPFVIEIPHRLPEFFVAFSGNLVKEFIFNGVKGKKEVRQACFKEIVDLPLVPTLRHVAHQELTERDHPPLESHLLMRVACDFDNIGMKCRLTSRAINMRKSVFLQTPYDFLAFLERSERHSSHPAELIIAAVEEAVITKLAGMRTLQPDIEHRALAQCAYRMGIYSVWIHEVTANS